MLKKSGRNKTEESRDYVCMFHPGVERAPQFLYVKTFCASGLWSSDTPVLGGEGITKHR